MKIVASTGSKNFAAKASSILLSLLLPIDLDSMIFAAAGKAASKSFDYRFDWQDNSFGRSRVSTAAFMGEIVNFQAERTQVRNDLFTIDHSA